jgi:hypothetical protein
MMTITTTTGREQWDVPELSYAWIELIDKSKVYEPRHACSVRGSAKAHTSDVDNFLTVRAQ